ncbi:MAG: hypothetical protein ACREDR_03555 [Blastocatellia bacterium]
MKRLFSASPIYAALILLALCQQTVAQDWRERIDEKARVRFSLPPDWTIK